MGGLNVKNTIVERVLQNIAPHPCYGCGKVGVCLCANCKNDIINEPYVGCVVCGTYTPTGCCEHHKLSVDGTYVVSQRNGALEEAINALKFSRHRMVARTLAALLHEALPSLPRETKVVGIPTIKKHVRQRGFDHVDVMARLFAKERGLEVIYPLRRVTTAVQHRSNRQERFTQASSAFVLVDLFSHIDVPLLIIDDIITTSSTIQAAIKTLQPVASNIYVAALAYQPLD